MVVLFRNWWLRCARKWSAAKDRIVPPKSQPTVFHITHWKAGSQWIHRILRELMYHRVVDPHPEMRQFLKEEIQPGKVYPTVYVTKREFDSVTVPANHRRFVVIRDLRDTLVSLYFSAMISHKPTQDHIRFRATFGNRPVEEGMQFVLEDWLPACALIQSSWLEAGEPLLRYEDLLQDDLRILKRVLLKHCRLDVSPGRFRETVLANRFERLTGRQRGQEDVTAHERKGVAGDWRNHLSDRLVRRFKERYGELLIATGYEKNNNW